MKNISKLVVISVVYKFPQKQLEKFKKNIVQQGVSINNIFIKDNTNDNIGYAAAINSIIKKEFKNFDYFLILNPDITLLGKDCIKNLINALEKDAHLGIVGPRMINNKKNIYIDGGSIDKVHFSSQLTEVSNSRKDTRNIVPVEYVSGSAMLIKKEVFKKIGFFKEDYFIYYEEVDFCLRAQKLGFKVAIVSSAQIEHAESSTVGKESPAMHYYMARNHLLFMERFAPWYIKVREILLLPKILYKAHNRKFELLGIKDYFFRKIGRNKDIYNQVDL